MKNRSRLLMIVGVSLTAHLLFSQDARRRAPDGAYSSSGGKVSATIEPRETVPDLDMLVHESELIVDGTVQDVLPAISSSGDPDVPSAETYSSVVVSEVLSDIWKAKPTSLFVVQEGGKAGKWEVETPQAPLVKKNERYIFFLGRDIGPAVFKTYGAPRYNVVGVWSGFVKVDAGKISFLPSAVAELHKNDGVDVDDFLALVRSRVSALVPADQIIMPKWCGPSGCPK